MIQVMSPLLLFRGDMSHGAQTVPGTSVYYSGGQDAVHF